MGSGVLPSLPCELGCGSPPCVRVQPLRSQSAYVFVSDDPVFNVCVPSCLQVQYNEAHPLPFDAVLVDEASMLDVQVGPGREGGITGLWLEEASDVPHLPPQYS